MNAVPVSDREILRELAKQVAEYAALPVMDERRGLWKKLNALQPERPMVVVNQIPWKEMDVDGCLTLRCEHPECREYERQFRQTVYRQTYMPDDEVVEPVIYVPKAVSGVTLGVEIMEEILVSDENSDVHSHRFVNQFTCMEDIDKIKTPVVVHDEAETSRRLSFARELFDGVLDIREEGYSPWVYVWDAISMWMGVENALYALADEPELIHALVSRMTEAQMSMYDQLEEQGLLCAPQPSIHCSGAWTDELPAEGYDPRKPRTKDIWTSGLAQMLGSVSPAMFDEFEIEPCLPLFKRFGMVYYGCCDPLDTKIDLVRKIPNLRKISASPWNDLEKFASATGRDYVLSNKPNPAFVAFESYDDDLVRSDLLKTKEICRRYGCPLEFILKDISTVRYQPQRLWKWAKTAMETAVI